MRSFSRFIGYIGLALASCLGFAGFATAADVHTIAYHARTVTADLGGYGDSVTKFKAELAHMQSIGSDRTGSSNSLIASSNGFVQANIFACSEVAEGESGVSEVATA